MDSFHLPWNVADDEPGDAPQFGERRMKVELAGGRVFETALFDDGDVPLDSFQLCAALQRRLRLDDDESLTWTVTLDTATGLVRIANPSKTWRPYVVHGAQAASHQAAWEILGYDLGNPFAFSLAHVAGRFPERAFFFTGFSQAPVASCALVAHQARGVWGATRTLGFGSARYRTMGLDLPRAEEVVRMRAFLETACHENGIHVFREANLWAKGRLTTASREALTTSAVRRDTASDRAGITIALVLDPDSP